MRRNAPKLLGRVLLAGLAAGLAAGPEARGDEEAPPVSEEATPSEAPPSVGLDRLLRLPDSLDYRVERRGDATRGEWRERFRGAREELAEAEAAVAEARKKLEGLAGETEAWQMAPPGVREAPDAPLSYQLRQELRRQRAEVERAEQRLQELEVQADLAGVPDDWRN